MLTETKNQLASANAALAAAKNDEQRLHTRLDQLSGELQTTEESIGALTLARKIALRKAALEAAAVGIDRSGLSAMQLKRDEITEMKETIETEIAKIQKDLPRLSNAVGTARRAFMAKCVDAKINSMFGKLRREDLVDLVVLNQGVAAGGRCLSLAELVPLLKPPGHPEISAAMLRLKAELGFGPF